jgi:hypothetical protein
MEQVSTCTKICSAVQDFFCVDKVEIVATYDLFVEAGLVIRPPSVQNCAGSWVGTSAVAHSQR